MAAKKCKFGVNKRTKACLKHKRARKHSGMAGLGRVRRQRGHKR